VVLGNLLMFRRLVALLLLVMLLITAILYDQYRAVPRKVSGFLEADEIRVGSRVGGRVRAVHVQEGERVAKGQLLVELEPFDLRERLREAEAQLAAREADVQRLEHGYRAEEIAQAEARYRQLLAEQSKLRAGPREQEIKVARAQLKVAQAELDLAQQSHARVVSLVEKRAAAAEELDRADERLKAATANVALREQQLDLQLVGTRQEDLDQIDAQVEESRHAWDMLKNGYRAEDVAAARAARDAAQYALDALQTQLTELRITSPLDGVVEAMELQPGDLAPPSAPVLSLLDDRQLWVRAYVPQNQVALHVGQTLKVVVDSFPRDALEGTVTFISRLAEFTPSNVQTPVERAKLVFRIKVSLQNADRKLLPGMSADIWLPDAEAHRE
jgi:multidrug resistance efflux pump